MLRAEESTRSVPESDHQVNAASKGHLVARCGIQAVNAAERAICGAGAVSRAATAEGFALAGKRAATLLEDEPSSAPSSAGSVAAAWVHHRLRPGQPGFGGSMVFELVAASAQEAIDHCLVAHRLAALLGEAGLCTADRSAVAGPHLVRLPEAETIEGVLGDAAPVGEGRPSGDAMIQAAHEAFARVAVETGRPAGPVTAYRMDGARVALVASGGSVRRAKALADALREAGIACGVVSVAMIRPFPADGLRQALGTAKQVAVAPPSVDPAERDQFVTRVQSVLGDVQVIEPSQPDTWAAALALDAKQHEATEAALQSADEAGESVVLGAAPAGDWSDQFLLDAAALLGSLGRLDLECPSTAGNAISTLALGTTPSGGESKSKLDLLFVADASLLGADGALLDAVRDGATVVFSSRATSPQSAATALGDARRQEFAARGIRLKWINSEITESEVASPSCVRTQLLGGFLSADESLARLVRAADLIGSLCSSSDAAGCETRTAELLQQGAGALQSIELAAVDPATLQHEVDVRPRRSLPLMVEGPEGGDVNEWAEKLHRFHLTGEGAHSPIEPLPPLPLAPAGLTPLASGGLMWSHYPFVLLPDGTAKSFAALAAEVVEAIEAGGGRAEVLGQQVRRLARTVSRVLESSAGATGLRDIVDEACRSFAGEFELSESGAAELQDEIDAFKERLPEAAELIKLDDHTLLRFHAASLIHERGPRRYDFVGDVKTLVTRLEELLQLDDAVTPAGRSSQALAANLGDGEGMRVDTEALSRILPEPRGSKRLPPERRARIEGTLTTLREWVEAAATEPECILVHPDLLPGEGQLPAARTVRHPNGLETAIGLFDGAAERMAAVVRAVRVARLETNNAYDPELHDDVLARLDWQAFSEDELLLLPAIVAVETGERLRGQSLSAFSALLRSGRPVQVLVLESATAAPSGQTWEALAGYHPGLGYIAVAHREAFVLQSTLAHPGRLLSGLRRMATALSPAAALISVPAWSVPVPPWVQLAATHFGRGEPLFRYDPSAGATWADRFDLSENPQPELVWPIPGAKYVDGSGTEHELDEPFTFAHAAALDPAYRTHFRLIPPQAWSDAQVPIADYLVAPDRERLRQVPYIWVVDDEGVLGRAVMTRELAFACFDHMRAWRILQELGGTDNEYARRAAEEARNQALAEAAEEKEKLEAEHAEAVEKAGRAAASDAMERLVAVLMSEDALAALSSGAPASAPAAPAAAPSAVEEPAADAAPAEAVEEAKEEEEEAVTFNEPYIDSMLCTTCNECTNLNGQMFQYNANRQATIADAGAGTFEQLVKAAEKCPARCIHPGAPRDDDPTVTDDLIARAAKFN
jgi:ferredoxin